MGDIQHLSHTAFLSSLMWDCHTSSIPSQVVFMLGKLGSPLWVPLFISGSMSYVLEILGPLLLVTASALVSFPFSTFLHTQYICGCGAQGEGPMWYHTWTKALDHSSNFKIQFEEPPVSVLWGPHARQAGCCLCIQSITLQYVCLSLSPSAMLFLPSEVSAFTRQQRPGPFPIPYSAEHFSCFISWIPSSSSWSRFF